MIPELPPGRYRLIHKGIEFACPYCGWSPTYALAEIVTVLGPCSDEEMQCARCDEMFPCPPGWYLLEESDEVGQIAVPWTRLAPLEEL